MQLAEMTCGINDLSRDLTRGLRENDRETVKSNFLNWRQTGETESSQNRVFSRQCLLLKTESSQNNVPLFYLASSTLHLSYVDRRHITGAFLLAITLGTD